MPLDEATRRLLVELEARGGGPIESLSPAQARLASGAVTSLAGAGPDMVSVLEERLTPPDGEPFRVRVLLPQERPDGVIVYYHGGGWVLGDIDQFDTLARLIAHRTGCAVVLPEYRKAPEHPFPSAVEDAWQALRWVDDTMSSLAGGRVPLVVMGDSAGGNLAAVVAQRSRDAGGPELALQVLVYPVTDADLETPSYLDPANQIRMTRQTMEWFWDHYADEAVRRHPAVSPLRATDLAGLPPALVVVAEYDVLRSEVEAYAAALTAAGVPTVCRLFEGQIHGFFSLVTVLPASASAIDFVVAGVRERLARPDSAPVP
jgi:acetyl esterase